MTQSENSKVPLRCGKGGVILSVKLMPKASSDEVQSVEQTTDGAVLKARVRAIADKGRANKALVELLSDWLGIAKSNISIGSGSRSRLKSVHFSGDETELSVIIRQKITELDS